MSVKRNIFANYLGSLVVALGPILALPYYLSELGPKQYGLIGFIAMLQATLNLLDAGMSQALVREISVRFNIKTQNNNRTATLLFSFERIYWIFSISIGLCIFLAADILVSKWLTLDGLPASLGRDAIYGAAAIFAVQLPGSLYRSILIGTQAQITLNVILISCALLRHIGGVIVITIWPTLHTYLIWHLSAALLETLFRGAYSWKIIQIKRNQLKWSLIELRAVWKLVAGMSGATLLGALTVQMDKIILSRMVNIEQFGYYTIATTVSLGTLQLINPLMQALLPRIIQIRNNFIALRNLNFKVAGIIALLTVLGAVFFIFTGKLFLNIWLIVPHETIEEIYSMLAVLLAGTALNAFYNIGYANWLAQQKINRILQVNMISFGLSIILTPLSIAWLGTIGAAIGWLIINLLGLVLSLEWLK